MGASGTHCEHGVVVGTGCVVCEGLLPGSQWTDNGREGVGASRSYPADGLWTFGFRDANGVVGEVRARDEGAALTQARRYVSRQYGGMRVAQDLALWVVAYPDGSPEEPRGTS